MENEDLTTGQEFVKKIRPLGAALFLILFAAVTVFLFTAKGVEVEGYVPPQTGSYYSAHVEELMEEVRDNLLPAAGVEGVELELWHERILVAGTEDQLRRARQAIIHYYDSRFFDFITKRE